jgi:D-alanine-D-alanine ligase
MNKLRILALVHRHLIPPDTIPDGTDIVSAPWRTEYDVISTLKTLGHEVRTLGVHDDLGDLRRAGDEWKPHIAFNLLEGFDDITIFDQNVVSHLELLKLSYTGCNPRGLLLARDKSLSKKLLAYHRIPVPEFEVFRIGRPIRRPKRLSFPLMVKSLTQEASIGISQASVVDTDEKLKERVTFIHESIGTKRHRGALHRGRELCWASSAIKSCSRCRSGSCSSRTCRRKQRIATDRVKWSVIPEKYGIESGLARRLPTRSPTHSARLQAGLSRVGIERLRADRSRLDEGGNVWGSKRIQIRRLRRVRISLRRRTRWSRLRVAASSESSI